MDYAGAEIVREEETNRKRIQLNVNSTTKRLHNNKLDEHQMDIDDTIKDIREREWDRNIVDLVDEIVKYPATNINNKPEPYFPKTRYNIEKDLEGPQNMIGYIAYILGYPDKEIQGKSIYGFIQDKTGWSLEFIRELGDFKFPRDVAERIKETYEL